jgi:hypothetical protein
MIVEDLKHLCSKPKSVTNSEPSKVQNLSTPIESLKWNPHKKTSLAALLSDGSLKVWRTDINKILSVVDSTAAVGDFEWSSSMYANQLVTMEKQSGTVSVEKVANFQIPVWNPRTGSIESFSDIGKRTIIYKSELHDRLFNLVNRLGRSPNMSLIDAIESSEDDELLDDIDWAIPDHVQSPTVEEPMSHVFSFGDEILSVGRNELLGIPVLTSPSRMSGLSMVIARRWQRILIPLVTGDFENLIRIFLNDKFPDHALVHSVTEIILNRGGGRNGPYRQLTTSCSPETIKDACDIINAILASPNDERKGALLREIRNKNFNPFVRVSFGLSYLESRELVEFLDELETPKIPTLRWIPILGLTKSHEAGILQGAFQLAMLALLLKEVGGSTTSQKNWQKNFHTSLQFIRSLCNQLRGNCWSLRAIIDTAIDDSSQSASAIVCYYCNKFLETADGIDTSAVTRCPNRGCHKPLPSCCVCLEPVQIPATNSSSSAWILLCGTCRHGGHKDHLSEWFLSFDECPVAGCNCQCANVDGA